MTAYRVDISYNGQTYSYPDGPVLPGLTVRITPNWIDFHYGTTTFAASQNVAQEHPTYTATIFADGVQIAQKTVKHWYFARRRHLLTPQTIKNTGQQLYDAGLVPPWAATVPGKIAAPPANWSFPDAMVVAPVFQPMGSAGERADIGTFHEGSGIFLLGGKPDSMLAFDEGLNAIPIYRIDERTGRFWDILTYPKATVYPGANNTNQSKPDYINQGPASETGEPNWEVAHHPEPAFVAFLATEDVYHLETLQATATQMFLGSNFHYYGAEPYATLTEGQTRGHAHSTRTLALVLIATKYYEDKFGAVPKPLNSYAYWKQVADNQLAHITRVWMNSPVTQTFRAYPQVAAYAPWQQDHLLNGLALLAWKYPEWRPLYVWAFYNLYMRCLHLPALPGPFQLRLGPTFIDGQIYDPAKLTVDQFYPDWPTMIGANLDLSINDPSGSFYLMSKAQALALKADPTNGGKWMEVSTYDMIIARNALALGVWLDRAGIVDLHTPYPQLEAVYAQQQAYAKEYWSRTGSYQPNRQAALAPTISSPPPRGGLHMSTPGVIIVGQTAHSNLTYDDPAQAPQNLAYAASPAGVVQLTQDAAGVQVKGLAAGTFVITATADNYSPATISGAVVPLAGALHLAWG